MFTTRVVFQQINDNATEIGIFEQRGRALWGGFGLAANYIERGRIFAMYSAEGRMIGGFCLILEGPFRTLEGLSEASRAQLLATCHASDFLEAYAVWLDPESKHTSLQIRFWYKAVLEAMKTRRKYMILGYNGEAAGLRRFWQDVVGFSLVERIERVDPRLNTHQHAEIVVGRIAGLPSALVRYSARRIRKAIGSRSSPTVKA